MIEQQLRQISALAKEIDEDLAGFGVLGQLLIEHRRRTQCLDALHEHQCGLVRVGTGADRLQQYREQCGQMVPGPRRSKTLLPGKSQPS